MLHLWVAHTDLPYGQCRDGGNLENWTFNAWPPCASKEIPHFSLLIRTFRQCISWPLPPSGVHPTCAFGEHRMREVAAESNDREMIYGFGLADGLGSTKG